MKSLLFWNKTYAAILSSLLALSLATACGGDDKKEEKEDDTPTTKEDCDKDDTMEWKNNACVDKETTNAEGGSEDSAKTNETAAAATTVNFASGTFTLTPVKAVKDKLADTTTAIDVSAQAYSTATTDGGDAQKYTVAVKSGVVTFKTFATGDKIFSTDGSLKAATDANAKNFMVKFTVTAKKGNGIAGDAKAEFSLKGDALQYLVDKVAVTGLKKFGNGNDAAKEKAFLTELDKLIKLLATK